MEQELNESKIDDFEYNNSFKLEHKNQDVTNKSEFKKWYKSAKEYVKKENIKRSKKIVEFAQNNIPFHYDIRYILTIEFCEKCMCYTICSIRNSYSYAICNKCQESFCIGCFRKKKKISNKDKEFDSTCLKGYLKAYYLRIIYRRSDIEETCACYNIIHIFFCLFMTPLYLGFLSYFMLLLLHPNIKRIKKEPSKHKLIFYLIYSILRGLLMFPYIILFFPFMIVLLLPGIFSYKYYLYIFIMYVTSLFQGINPLINVGDN